MLNLVLDGVSGRDHLDPAHARSLDRFLREPHTGEVRHEDCGA